MHILLNMAPILPKMISVHGIIILVGLFAEASTLITVRARQYRLTLIPTDALTVLESPTMLHCELQAFKLQYLTFAYDGSSQTCQIGIRKTVQLNDDTGSQVLAWARGKFVYLVVIGIDA